MRILSERINFTRSVYYGFSISACRIILDRDERSACL